MFGAEPVASLELLQQRLWKLASPDILHRGQCHARSMSHSGDGDDDRLESTSTRTFEGGELGCNAGEPGTATPQEVHTMPLDLDLLSNFGGLG
jgi:hypothetical protein